MPGSRVALPRKVAAPFTVYRNGVLQSEGTDYTVHGRTLEFPTELRKDKISGWRWFVGAWGVGTYRQHDSIDIHYKINKQPPKHSPVCSRPATRSTSSARASKRASRSTSPSPTRTRQR